MRVWIDQDLCTGDGLCTDHAPEVFTLLEDGIAYVKQHDRVLNDPGGSASLALVPAPLLQATVNAAEDCPGECIFIEVD
jgi:ferredoxin